MAVCTDRLVLNKVNTIHFLRNCHSRINLLVARLDAVFSGVTIVTAILTFHSRALLAVVLLQRLEVDQLKTALAGTVDLLAPAAINRVAWHLMEDAPLVGVPGSDCCVLCETHARVLRSVLTRGECAVRTLVPHRCKWHSNAIVNLVSKPVWEPVCCMNLKAQLLLSTKSIVTGGCSGFGSAQISIQHPTLSILDYVRELVIGSICGPLSVNATVPFNTEGHKSVVKSCNEPGFHL